MRAVGTAVWLVLMSLVLGACRHAEVTATSRGHTLMVGAKEAQFLLALRGASLLTFQGSGEYVETRDAHGYGVSERDRGSWRDGIDEQVILESRTVCSSLASGPFVVSIRRRANLPALPGFRQKVQDLLAGATGTEVFLDQAWADALDEYWPTTGGVPISLYYSDGATGHVQLRCLPAVQPFPRQTLQTLIRDIASYENDPAAQCLRYLVVDGHGRRLLVPTNVGMFRYTREQVDSRLGSRGLGSLTCLEAIDRLTQLGLDGVAIELTDNEYLELGGTKQKQEPQGAGSSGNR